MKEIVVISGKGGTGKTSIAASFGILGGEKVIMADCDVDAADMHLLMQPDFAKAEDFYSGVLALINPDKCTNCGNCAEVCRFNAIDFVHGKHVVNELNCEGCGYCSKVCPVDAIKNIDQNVGVFYISNIKTGSSMVHAKLKIGADNTGKLVAKVKNEAKQLAMQSKAEMIIVDGSPGVGCPVVSSLSGADYVVLVTESSVSGLHDLKRVHELLRKFRLKSGCIINKFDLNPAITKKIRDYLNEESIDFIGEFPYDEVFTKSMSLGQTIVEYDENRMNRLIHDAWLKIKNAIIKTEN